MTHRDAFSLLYEESMSRVRRQIGGLRIEEREWYQGVLLGFEREFQVWDQKPVLADYLRRADACRFRALGVLAYVYLHVAYDLPRICARELRSSRTLSWDRCALAFADSGVHIAEATAHVLGRLEVTGVFSYILRAIPGAEPMATPVAQWILAHRCVAWRTAERLAALPDSCDAELELWKRVEVGMRGVIRSSNPLRWMRDLPLMD